MAPGVLRPYSVTDVIGSLADGISALAAGSTTTGTGHFLEADETLGVTDSVTVAAQAAAGWDAGQWGQVTWG